MYVNEDNRCKGKIRISPGKAGHFTMGKIDGKNRTIFPAEIQAAELLGLQ